MFFTRHTLNAGLLLCFAAQMVQAQTRVLVPGNSTSASTLGNSTIQFGAIVALPSREQMALEVAKLAAENGSQDLSLDAFTRVMDNVVHLDDSRAQRAVRPSQNAISNLLGNSADIRGVRAQFNRSYMLGNSFASNDYLPLVFDLLNTWKSQQFDSTKVAAALERAVLPPQDPDAVRSFALTSKPATRTAPTPAIFTPSGPSSTASTSVTRQSTPIRGPSTLNDTRTFRSPTLRPAIGFELIHFASEANKLEEILMELQKRSLKPNGQEAHALIVYGLRCQGRTEQAAQHVTKLLDALGAGPNNVGSDILSSDAWELLVQAAMQPVPKDLVDENGQPRPVDLWIASQQMPIDVIDRLVQRGIAYYSSLIGPYFQHLIRDAIQKGDAPRLKTLGLSYFNAIDVSASLPTSVNPAEYFPGYEVANECIRLNQTYMTLPVLEAVQDHIAKRNRVQNQQAIMERRLSTLLALQALPIEQRIAFTEALLLDSPISSVERFHFVALPASAAPDFFLSPERRAAIRMLQAHPHARSLSLLDCWLNDARATGKFDETVDRLLRNQPEQDRANSPIARLLHEWIQMHCQANHHPLPTAVASESRTYAYDEKFAQWYLSNPEFVRNTLKKHYEALPNRAAMEAIERLTPVDASASSNASMERPQSKLLHWVPIQLSEPTVPVLILKYPLQGNHGIRFQVNLDGNSGSFGGMMNGTLLSYSRKSAAAVSARLTSNTDSAISTHDNPLTSDSALIQCTLHDDAVALKIDEKPFLQARFLSHSFPFAGITESSAATKWSKFEITGAPEIARSVTLLDESFSGWNAGRYERPLVNVLEVRSDPTELPVASLTSSAKAGWKMEGNELVTSGAVAAGVDSSSQLRRTHNSLLYARPLLDGEKFEYELFCENRIPRTYPVIGLTAFLLEDQRVRLHWLPTSQDTLLGIAHDNRADDPQAEQLQPANLAVGEWNKFSLRIEDKRVIFSINDRDVYRRPVPAQGTTEFGWLNFADQPGDRIRRAALTGNWPTKLPDDLFELAPN